MRNITTKLIKDTVIKLVGQANLILRSDIYQALKSAFIKETNRRAKKILQVIIDNASVAKKEGLAICQDTGLPVVFVKIGQDVHVSGGSLEKAINQGIDSGYRRASLRNSIIIDPILRGKPGFMPAVIHSEIITGSSLKITVLPKGFGCENKSQVKMFRPTASIEAIKEFIVKVVKDAGPDACPPYVVGVGIGGTQDYVCFLAKKALLKKIKNQKSKIKITNQNSRIYKLEKDLLKEINKLNIGPMGLGGKTTVLAVNIETYPTHIAGLPVAVNISCHALRSATKTL